MKDIILIDVKIEILFKVKIKKLENKELILHKCIFISKIQFYVKLNMQEYKSADEN